MGCTVPPNLRVPMVFGDYNPLSTHFWGFPITGSHVGNLGYIPFFPLIQKVLQAMRAGILSVARKALDGCSLMNTLAAQVAADLGYATEAWQKSLAGKTTSFLFEKRTNGGKNCVPTKRSKKDPSGGENLEFHSGTRSKSFPLKFGKIFICQFVSCVGIQ